jgi:hypothetical protein
MRAALTILAIVLATLRVVQAMLTLRLRGAAVVGGAPAGDRATSRFAAWRYYGFSSRPQEADGSDAEAPEIVANASGTSASAVVANSPPVGSVVSILPDGCVTTVVDGRVYRQCGSVWYQRQYTGSKVTYVVVPAP